MVWLSRWGVWPLAAITVVRTECRDVPCSPTSVTSREPLTAGVISEVNRAAGQPLPSGKRRAPPAYSRCILGQGPGCPDLRSTPSASVCQPSVRNHTTLPVPESVPSRIVAVPTGTIRRAIQIASDDLPPFRRGSDRNPCAEIIPRVSVCCRPRAG